MKKMSLIASIVLLICSCSNQNFTTEQEHKDSAIREGRGEGSSFVISKDESFKYTYGFTDDENSQTLSVNFLKKKSISFKITCFKDGEVKLLEGVAELVTRDGDGESIADDEGNLFFVEEYIYWGSDGCNLAIRIDEDSQAAQLFLKGCADGKDLFHLNYDSVMKPIE